MCGICGIVGLEPSPARTEKIRSMCQRMAHRGPDAQGIYEEQLAALGHRRLSIIDLSDAANQPFHDASGRLHILFNGEIYNYREVRGQLTGYPFVTSSDTEVILAAYLRWGAGALEKLVGMFAFAIWDSEDQSLFVARDRLGVKPFYYACVENCFVFASEIRSILESGMVQKKQSTDAVFDYLKLQSVVGPLTLVEGIMQLPNGHSGKWKNGRFEHSAYWSITGLSNQSAENYQQALDGVRKRMFTSVERRLVADVPVGAFLSGGVDSSAIVAIMAQVSSKKPVAFTVSFEEKAYDESVYAELVAIKYGVDHSKVLLRPEDFLQQLPAALNALDTPSGDGLNTYVVSRAIRQQGIPVALSGVGGDELFGGYPIFEQYRSLYRLSGVYTGTRMLREIAAAFLPGQDRKREQIRQLLACGSAAIEEVYPVLRQILSPRSIRKLFSAVDPAFGGTLEKTLIENAAAIKRFPIYSQVSIADYLGYTQHVLLKDTDQMSMAHSLEVREPFFDHELVEFVLALPDAYKRGSYPKQLLVEALKPLVPDEVVHRKKMGFVLPYDKWMRRELRSFCSGKMQNLADRKGFNGHYIMNFWNDFLSRKSGIRWADVWTLVVLENWLEENKIQ